MESGFGAAAMVERRKTYAWKIKSNEIGVGREWNAGAGGGTEKGITRLMEINNLGWEKYEAVLNVPMSDQLYLYHFYAVFFLCFFLDTILIIESFFSAVFRASFFLRRFRFVFRTTKKQLPSSVF